MNRFPPKSRWHLKIEKGEMIELLRVCPSRAQAARILAISPDALKRRLDRLGIERLSPGRPTRPKPGEPDFDEVNQGGPVYFGKVELSRRRRGRRREKFQQMGGLESKIFGAHVGKEHYLRRNQAHVKYLEKRLGEMDIMEETLAKKTDALKVLRLQPKGAGIDTELANSLETEIRSLERKIRRGKRPLKEDTISWLNDRIGEAEVEMSRRKRVGLIRANELVEKLFAKYGSP